MFESADGSTNWANIIRLMASLGSVGTGVSQAFKKEPLPYGVREAAQATNNANTYMAASADPSSPYFRNIAEGEEQRGRNDLITSIDRIMRELASRGASGRGTINPERRDETVWGLLAKGFQEAGMRARETARSHLLNMAGGQQRSAAAYGGLTQPSMLTQLFNRQSQNAGYAGAFKAFDSIAGLMGKGKPGEKPGTKAFGEASVPDEYKNWPGNVGL